MPNFSDEQKQVIGERERNLLVSASAGSGKTTVMIERIATLIEEGKTKLSRVLILTFTNNSANDMKEKLYRRLSASTNPNCKNALFDIQTANISNIHQFCKKLIQKYFFVCNVDPAFSVISENEALVLKDRALDKTIQNFFYNDNEKLDAFLESNFEKRNFNKIKDMVLSLFTFLSILDEPQRWLDERATKGYEQSASESQAVKILCKNAKFVLGHYSQEFAEIIKHIERFFSREEFDYFYSFCENLNTLNAEENIEKLVNNLLAFEPKCKCTSKNDEITAFHKENIKPLFDEFKDDFDKVQSSFSASSTKELENFLKSNKMSGEFLCELARQFCTEYAKIKEEKFLLDFDDLEAKAKLLLDDSKIRDEIRNSFDYIFIDEYQDINILQDSIIGSVSKNSFYFGVGDAKQAIYGFRLCSPEIFISKFSTYKKETDKNLAASLNKNFRSKINILRFVNKIFDVIMTDQTANINYKDEARFEGNNLDETAKVKINVILSDKKEKAKLPEVYSVKNHDFSQNDESDADKEAEIAFREIEKLREGGAEYRDIAILARNRDTNSFVKKFFTSLQNKGIPVVASFRVNILTYKEISLIHNLLKLLENFKDDVTLYKVLTFPFFGFSINRLLEIRESSNEKYFADCFLARSDDGDVKKFLEFYNKLALLSQNMSVLKLAEHIMELLIGCSSVEVLNSNTLNHFESYLNFIKQINPGSLTEYVQLTQSEEMDSSSAQSGNDNAVTFCTIHSSKGLEYKHVILIGCGKKLNLDGKDDVLIDENIGVGIKGFDENEEKRKTPIYSAIKINGRRKNFAEEIRLLYVALTRAKESLSVIGTIKGGNFEKLTTFRSDFEILKVDNYLELILRSLSSGELSRLKSSGAVDLVYEKNEVAKCEVLGDVKATNEKAREEKPCTKTKEEIDKAIQNWQKITDVQTVYLKNSVTSIMKNTSEEADYSNNLVGDEKGSSLIGTAYHEALSKLDFAPSDKNKKVPDGLDKKYFDKFFESELYKFCSGKKLHKELPFLFYNALPEQFGFGDEKILLQGVIDLIVEEDDGFTVVDYKASSAPDETLTARYKTQLDLYAYCAEKILNKKCKKKLIYKIFLGKTIEIE